jgi:hypothetical protein
VGPTRIWLQPLTEDHRDGWTWCWHEIGEADAPDIAYVRVDVVDDLAEALRMAEWADDGHCPVCGNFIDTGHASLCEVRAALSRMEGTGNG